MYSEKSSNLMMRRIIQNTGRNLKRPIQRKTNMHIKIHSISLIIGEMKTEITVLYYYISRSLAKIKKIQTPNARI